MPISITRFALSMYANIASVFASTTSVVQRDENSNIVSPAANSRSKSSLRTSTMARASSAIIAAGG